jgi:hypothetical protein
MPPSRRPLARRDLLKAGAAARALASSRTASSADEGRPFVTLPYLQLGDASRLRAREQVVVVWHAADRDAAWAVDFRSEGASNWSPGRPAAWERVAVETIDPHRVYRVLVDGLDPGRPFEYRVRLGGKPVFTARGRARKRADQPWRCVVMGDVGTNSAPQKQVAVEVHRADPDFVLIPGDVMYSNGRISEYRTNYFPIYNAAAPDPSAGAPLIRSTPFFAGLGEHDCGQPLSRHPDGFAFFMYFSLPLNGPALDGGGPHAFPLGGSPDRQRAVLAATGPRYPRMATYSFDYGNAHWVVLDTWNPAVDWTDPVLRSWLAADLAGAEDATWKLVSSYLPPFNSSTAYPHTQKMRLIVDLLEEAGVDVVFSGYAHSYQVTYPLRFQAEPKPPRRIADPGHPIPGRFRYDRSFDGRTRTRPDGILYITTGGGGNPSLHSPEQTDNPRTWQEYTVKYNASVHHFSLLEADGASLTIRQVRQDGAELDRIVLTKA